MDVLDANEMSTTITKPDDNESIGDEESELTLSPIEVTQCNSVVAIANHLVADRPDIHFACHKLSARMPKPTTAVWQRLTRLARYIKG